MAHGFEVVVIFHDSGEDALVVAYIWLVRLVETAPSMNLTEKNKCHPTSHPNGSLKGKARPKHINLHHIDSYRTYSNCKNDSRRIPTHQGQALYIPPFPNHHPVAQQPGNNLPQHRQPLHQAIRNARYPNPAIRATCYPGLRALPRTPAKPKPIHSLWGIDNCPCVFGLFSGPRVGGADVILLFSGVCHGCLAVPESIPAGVKSELPCGVVKHQVLQNDLMRLANSNALIDLCYGSL